MWTIYHGWSVVSNPPPHRRRVGSQNLAAAGEDDYNIKPNFGRECWSSPRTRRLDCLRKAKRCVIQWGKMLLLVGVGADKLGRFESKRATLATRHVFSFTQKNTSNCKMATLDAKINDPTDVIEAMAAMGNPDCGREYAERQIGGKGNQVVRDYLAPALENCRVKGICIEFRYCNLDQASVQLLANAVKKNTCIGGFACEENPFNFPDGRNYDPRTDEPVKRAIIASKAPIIKWNGWPLPPDMVEARSQRVAVATVAVPAPVAVVVPPPVPPLAPSLKTLPTLPDIVEARSQRAAAVLPPALPTLEDHVLAQAGKVKEEQVLTECRAKLEADTKELEETRARSATLERGIAQTAARVQAAQANIAKHVYVLDTVAAMSKCMSSFTPAPPSNNANLCGVCFDREKNQVFIECGHLCCGTCTDRIMQTTEECPFCRANIVRAIPIFN
ncbi:hypothetical protein BASA81_006725 [Batrachochytrium salamandrivorans]|nr:hypothetical protein BASA81_006725 [Batrachochytrium salamandrivorans]